MGQRLEVLNYHVSKGESVTKVLKFCSIPSSTYYDSLKNSDKKSPPGKRPPGYSFNRNAIKVYDSKIVDIIKNYRSKTEFQNSVGCKALHHYIKRDYSVIVNHKKIYRLCKKNLLLLPKNTKKIKFNRKLSKNRSINKPNMLWQFDIKTGYIHGENKYFYFLAIIDVFTREVMNYHIGYNCKAKDLLSTIKEAIKIHKPNLVELAIRSDNGPQMTSKVLYNYVEEIGLEHEFIPKKTPNKNAYIESFFSIFETQLLQVLFFKNFGEVFEKVVDYVKFYNSERLHGSLNYVAPLEFKEKYHSGELENYVVAA